MTQRIVITCDECNLEKGRHNEEFITAAWLHLRNIDLPSHTTNKVRLVQDHYFCSFLCLSLWSSKAKNSSLSLVESAKGITPRGTFVNEELGLQY